MLYVVIAPPPENRAVYEIMCEKHGRTGLPTDVKIILRVRFTHSEYVLLIPFARQQW